MRFSPLASLVLAIFVFFAVAPGCGRSSLEPESLDSGVAPPRPCSPSTCPTGCCDATGSCRIGTDERFCGSAGSQCTDCIAQGFSDCDERRVCGRDDPECSPESCPSGCCSNEGGRQRCLSGIEAGACGGGGSACIDCTVQGRACDSRTRDCTTVACNPTNCKGCCVGDQCLTGTDITACGTGGSECRDCAAAGQTCRPADIGGRCEGTPTCNQFTCGGGCCVGSTCVAGTDSTACGKGGVACNNCAAQGRVCVPDGQPNERTCQLRPTCGPANCAGCCRNGQCVLATTPQACGRNGQQCRTCAATESCNNGTCTPAPVCSPANCGQGGGAGCCAGAVCAAGTQDQFCGRAGQQCQNCAATGRVCQGGTCQRPTCGPGTCAGGCCSGNVCTVGIQDNACGRSGGAACEDCTQNGEVCNTRTRRCVEPCGPANCVGCCRDATTCIVNDTNTECGSGGVKCVNCQAQGFMCNKTVRPHVCSN